MERFGAVCLEVEVEVLERGVLGSLCLEAEVVPDGEKGGMVELQVGEEVLLAVVLRVMEVLQSNGSLIDLGVLGLCVKVEAEVELEGGEGLRAEASSAVHSHEEGEEFLQLLEDERELVGFLLAFEGDVAKGLFIGLGSLGQFLVLVLQVNEASDVVLNCGEAIEWHFGSDW